MGWDGTRRVPWKRLLIEWLVVGTIVIVVSATLFDNRQAESYLAIIMGGAIYVGLGALLAKFGYQRAGLAELRAQSAARQSASQRVAASPPARQRPTPTKRTGGSSRRPGTKPRR